MRIFNDNFWFIRQFCSAISAVTNWLDSGTSRSMSCSYNHKMLDFPCDESRTRK